MLMQRLSVLPYWVHIERRSERQGQIYSLDASATVQYCSSCMLVRSSIIEWSLEVVRYITGWSFTVGRCFTGGSFSVGRCFTVAEGQGNTVGLIVFVYSDQISTTISNKIR